MDWRLSSRQWELCWARQFGEKMPTVGRTELNSIRLQLEEDWRHAATRKAIEEAHFSKCQISIPTRIKKKMNDLKSDLQFDIWTTSPSDLIAL